MWITLVGLTIFSVASAIDVKPTLPDHLKECYNSSSIVVKDNLLPFTVSTLISIIRKLEDSFTTDMRILTPAILKRYRYDGIQRNPELEWSDVVIPYNPEVSEFSLFQVLYQWFIPSAQQIPNNTLTYLERCTLHSMLSSSIDPWDRNDNNEPCTKISQYSSVSNWDWNGGGGGVRFPRDTNKLNDAEVFDPKLGPNSDKRVDEDQQSAGAHSGDFQQYLNSFPQSQCPVENGVVFDKYGTFSPGIVLAGIATGLSPENVPISSILGTGGYPRYMSRRPPPGGVRFPYDRPGQKISSSSGNQGGYGNQGGFGNQGGYGNQDGFSNQGGTGNRNGFGNQGGTGNSGGFGNSGGPRLSFGGNSEVDNRYAATLSGVLAEVALLLGPSSDTRGTSLKIGMSGGWNDTAVPKYYFVRDYLQNGLSDPKIRGALDGLILAKEVKQWSDTASGSLKLSQVLGMYYSNLGLFGTNVKSCSRRDHMAEVVSDAQLKDYTALFGLVLTNYLPSSASIQEDGIQKYTSLATEDALHYISSMTERCPDQTTSYITKPAVDLHVVIDASQEYKDMIRIVTYLADNMAIDKYSSNFSLIGGYDGNVYIDSAQELTIVQQNFTINMYNTMHKGFNFDKVLSALRVRFQSKMKSDDDQSVGGGNPRVVLFIPQANAKVDDKDNLINKINSFRANIPDVKFLYLVSGTKDKFNPFADDAAKDIFTYSLFDNDGKSLDPVIDRISTVPKRIINPNCGPYWSGGWYNRIVLAGYLNRPEVHYYRLHPNYFYKNTNAKVTIKNEDRSTTITVCSSRKILQPSSNSSKSTTSTSSNSNCFQLTSNQEKEFTVKSEDCPNSLATNCDPYYFSINTEKSAVTQLQGSASCTDPTCKFPNMVKYSIEHQGLSCYSGVGTIIISPILIIFFVCINLWR